MARKFWLVYTLKSMLITIIGSIAAFLTTVCQIPQLLQILKSHHTKDISLPTYTYLGVGVFLWAIYGYFVKDIVVLLANIFTFIIVFWIWLLKLKYG